MWCRLSSASVCCQLLAVSVCWWMSAVWVCHLLTVTCLVCCWLSTVCECCWLSAVCVYVVDCQLWPVDNQLSNFFSTFLLRLVYWLQSTVNFLIKAFCTWYCLLSTLLFRRCLLTTVNCLIKKIFWFVSFSDGTGLGWDKQKACPLFSAVNYSWLTELVLVKLHWQKRVWPKSTAQTCNLSQTLHG